MEHGFLDATELQRQTLRLYGELVARRESWAGRLVFACGEDVSATGLPSAVSLAGGTTLALDPDAASVKRVFRTGGVDFVVNTLDEALRVLKNEIRKHRPLSVGLVAELHTTLAEMVERGVLPDLQVSIGGVCEGVVAPGVERLRLLRAERIAASSELFAGWLTARGWSEVVLRAGTTAELRDLDARVLALLPERDGLRRAWVQRIGHYQRPGPGGVRVVWLTQDERAAMKTNSAD